MSILVSDDEQLRCDTVLTYSLLELPRHRLARHQAALTDQQSAFLVKSGNSKNDLLRAILKHSLLPLLQEAE